MRAGEAVAHALGQKALCEQLSLCKIGGRLGIGEHQPVLLFVFLPVEVRLRHALRPCGIVGRMLPVKRLQKGKKFICRRAAARCGDGGIIAVSHPHAHGVLRGIAEGIGIGVAVLRAARARLGAHEAGELFQLLCRSLRRRRVQHIGDEVRRLLRKDAPFLLCPLIEHLLAAVQNALDARSRRIQPAVREGEIGREQLSHRKSLPHPAEGEGERLILGIHGQRHFPQIFRALLGRQAVHHADGGDVEASCKRLPCAHIAAARPVVVLGGVSPVRDGLV